MTLSELFQWLAGVEPNFPGSRSDWERNNGQSDLFIQTFQLEKETSEQWLEGESQEA